MLVDGFTDKAIEYLENAARCLADIDSSKYDNINLAQRRTVASSDPACLPCDDNYIGKSTAYMLYYGYIAGGYFDARNNRKNKSYGR